MSITNASGKAYAYLYGWVALAFWFGGLFASVFGQKTFAGLWSLGIETLRTLRAPTGDHTFTGWTSIDCLLYVTIAVAPVVMIGLSLWRARVTGRWYLFRNVLIGLFLAFAVGELLNNWLEGNGLVAVLVVPMGVLLDFSNWVRGAN
jgi:hypothetical protein